MIWCLKFQMHVLSVRTIKVTNGTLTDDGDGVVTLDTGGASTLVALDDVQITNPFEGQSIRWDDGLQRWVKDLNNLYRSLPALHEQDFDPAGFEWIDCDDAMQSTLSLIRRGRTDKNEVVVVCNFTPLPRFNYRLGVPRKGFWREVLNSDGIDYGGGGIGNLGGTGTDPIAIHGRHYSLNLTIPPLAVVYFKHEGDDIK